MNFSILGTGMFVPERIVTNDDLATIVETDDEWIRQRVGIARRHVCTTETTTDLAYGAAAAALENAGVRAEELDLILSATVSGDNVSPSLACMIQSRLGASCPAYEINAACAAFIFLLETAAGYFARRALSQSEAITLKTLRVSKGPQPFGRPLLTFRRCGK